jgi:alpha-L-fucosidase
MKRDPIVHSWNNVQIFPLILIFRKHLRAKKVIDWIILMEFRFIDLMYQATLESLKTHQVPQWFEDAKFGIFIHWGLYSVPGYAILKEERDRGKIDNLYAEWYLNSIMKRNTPTWAYHKQKFGANFDYYSFKETFNQEIKKWDPQQMADLFQKAGAKYVVQVTKHHDGFCMWPTKYPNPKRENLFCTRDVVGELAAAVRSKGMRFSI